MRSSPLLAAALALTALAGDAWSDVTHVYQRGETLASIAQRYYGNPSLEPVIVAANYLYVQAAPALAQGVHLTIPSVTYERVAAGDTWERLAMRHLGLRSRAGYLAQVNRGQFNLSPSPGTVIRVPYLLRWVITDDEPLFELARRFYGDRAQVTFILAFNGLSSQRVTRGQVLLLPLPDVVLRDPAQGGADPGVVAAHAEQRGAERELPTLRQLVDRGLYVEAVGLGARLAAVRDLATAQRVAVHRLLAEAYVALDRRDLAADALRVVVATDPSYRLDAETTSPKVMEAWIAARGTAPANVLNPAPPTARPDSAH